jgi:hypothetical protein
MGCGTTASHRWGVLVAPRVSPCHYTAVSASLLLRPRETSDGRPWLSSAALRQLLTMHSQRVWQISEISHRRDDHHPPNTCILVQLYARTRHCGES